MKTLLSSHKVLFAICLILAVGASSCKKIEDLLTFQINDSTSFQVPATGVFSTALLSLPGATVNSSSSNTYSANNTSADHVQDVTLDRLTLTVTDPAGQNFDFLKSVSIYIATDASGTNKTLLASLNPVPTGQTTITLTPSGNKLDAYLRNGSYTLFTDVTMAQPLRQNTTLRADSRFNVKAKLK
ncbi:hypothetical protein [Hymenobacter properus]|uniref:Uncharacterized protein n=1 Tax=Hymenobacter properus TaxID=2791026 RepID=A0A931BEU5_9BACT|nr:hypothetical protein [Hymenobacter properus]MBF9140987.1 hypothetical protein [Hymenobacter properus]MBR7719796.1 hypothetical protein [Microvirga sp. SRT04]